MQFQTSEKPLYTFNPQFGPFRCLELDTLMYGVQNSYPLNLIRFVLNVWCGKSWTWYDNVLCWKPISLGYNFVLFIIVVLVHLHAHYKISSSILFLFSSWTPSLVAFPRFDIFWMIQRIKTLVLSLKRQW